MFTRFGNYKYTLKDSTRRARHSRVKNDKKVDECKNCGIPTGNVGEVRKGLCNLCALASRRIK